MSRKQQADKPADHWTHRLPKLAYIVTTSDQQVFIAPPTTCMTLKLTVFKMLNKLMSKGVIDQDERDHQRHVLDRVINDYSERFYEMKKRAQNKRVFDRDE